MFFYRNCFTNTLQDDGVHSFGVIDKDCFDRLRKNELKRVRLPEELDPGEFPNQPTF